MRRALPAVGTFTLTLLFLDPIRLPELAAGLGAAAGAAAVVLLLTAGFGQPASRRHSRGVLPPAASQPPTQPMSFTFRLPVSKPEPGFPGWASIEAEHPPVDWDALHLAVARDWNVIMRRPDEAWGTADMTEFEEKWKTS